MKSRTYKIAFALMTGLVAVALGTSQASATNPNAFLAPGFDQGLIPHPNLPKFGFSSYNIGGYGERVTRVRYGGLASRFGLEAGDVILSLNNHRLSYPGSWNDSLFHAMSSGGWVRLKIRDWRTGNVFTRQMYVGGFGGGIGPITPKIHKGPNHDPPTKKLIHPKHDEQLSKFNKKVAQLFD